MWVLEHSVTTLGARLVLLALAEHADDDGKTAFPSVETIARKARMTPKAAREALRRLERDGHVAKVGVSPYGTNIYDLAGVPPVVTSSPVRGERSRPPAEATSQNEEATSEKGTSTLAEPSFEPSFLTDTDIVVSAWTSHAPPLVAHRESYFTDAKCRDKIRRVLKTYPAGDVAKAIVNYATVLGSADYFWSHSWTIVDFLQRGLDKFVDEAQPLVNFRSRAGMTPAASSFTGIDDFV